MIRIEIHRGTPAYKRTRSRNAGGDGSHVVTYEATEAEALAHVATMHAIGAPDGFPVIAARLFDADTYRAWVRDGGDTPKPFRTITNL